MISRFFIATSPQDNLLSSCTRRPRDVPLSPFISPSRLCRRVLSSVVIKANRERPPKSFSVLTSLIRMFYGWMPFRFIHRRVIGGSDQVYRCNQKEESVLPWSHKIHGILPSLSLLRRRARQRKGTAEEMFRIMTFELILWETLNHSIRN